MDAREAASLVAYIALGDNRRVDDLTVRFWHEALADVAYADARAVVAEYRQASTDYLQPAHVRAGVRRLRDRHLERLAVDFPEFPGDPDDVAGELQWRRAVTRAVADGAPIPEAAALVARPMPALAGVFRGVPARDGAR